MLMSQKLLRVSMLRAAYASRSSIYACSGLAGDVDDHGSDRIHKKLVAELKAIAAKWQLDVTTADIKAAIGAPI